MTTNKEGYRLEYDSDDKICIIPDPAISLEHFTKLADMYCKKLGYKWWFPADERKGFIFSKKENK